ncbi:MULTISPECIES: phosphonate ABC transporter ATP-binding protein [Bacillaceae]|uniref:Phosphonate ABC transporter ATP-binding protein n=1 Tax=Evansella alkalicola TaxID=745819 RepID=A0ABS6K0K2_9BACI|nr:MULTISPECIES: phosphonate ABC transporter ATP-binding protein [Bacillaceae]MBU9723464.1 phosphonate ABC transporter ATP-binding protein [Bacillus alkalicola]
MNTIEIQNLSKVYPDGTKALNNVSFNVKPGEAVVLLGHNGSGKSTLFRCITSFEKPTEGQIKIDGVNITKLSKGKLRPIRKKVGMVFQHFNLINNLSVFQNVLSGAMGKVRFAFQTFAPLASKELRREAMECLERVGLSDLAKRRADQLSGGQQQRVAIARMLMQNPQVVLADEPIASLDPKAGREVMDLLWEIVRERGLTVVCILHQMDIAKEYGDRIVALKSGKVVIDDHIHDLNDELMASLYEKEMVEEEDKENIMAAVKVGGM